MFGSGYENCPEFDDDGVGFALNLHVWFDVSLLEQQSAFRHAAPLSHYSDMIFYWQSKIKHVNLHQLIIRPSFYLCKDLNLRLFHLRKKCVIT